jgi:two-component system, NarL family, sensor kinase
VGVLLSGGDHAVPHTTDLTVEAMRRRLARMAFDVHDGPMQELIALSYGLQALQKKVAGELDRDQVHSEFEQLGARLVETEQMLRSMMFALEQTSAEPTDQSTIVERQVAAFRDRCPAATVEVVASGNVELQTDSQRIALDRVLRESLSNIAKHADADNVTVRLQGLRDVLVVQISDDGRGFEAVDERFGARVGLRAMRDRLEMIGGTLTIDSRPGGPTTISATIEKWQPQQQQAS